MVNPEFIGPYRVIRELGSGRMGVVYLAEDAKLKRRIAIKLLKEKIAQEPAELARFEREARLLAAIQHPNIATVYSLEEADQLHFLTMEFVDGQTLRNRISQGPLSNEEILALHRQIASALESAHQAGIIHRDLKPMNIMITAEGRVKVLDFGLAKASSKPHEDTADILGDSSSPGLIVGTPGYMSPEQLRGHEVDHRTDVWAFGCVLYESLTGEPPFPGETYSDRIATTLEHEPDWDALPGDLNTPIQRLIDRCLQKDVNRRLGRIVDARREIEEIIAHGSLSLGFRVRGAVSGDRPNNLPIPISKFVGRARQKEEIKALIADQRLVTLTGAGGSGKTRLALQLGEDTLGAFEDGVWFVEVAPLSDPEQVPQATAGVLGLSEAPNRTLTGTITEHLRDKNLLLILDNCEHLLSACAELIITLLEGSPAIRILATSRQDLGIQGERIYRVPALAVPETGGEQSLANMMRVEAVQLFTERAAAVNKTFTLTESNAPAVAQLCRSLDGIPLALELAAARVKMMTVEEITGRLDDRFRLLRSGSRTSLPHQQTLEGLIDWSWDHLPEAERALMRRLAVFAGGWTLGACEEICAGDGIEPWDVLDLHARLIDKSLVEVDAKSETGRARYRMLETVRLYALDRLREAKEELPLRQRHMQHFLRLAEEAETRLPTEDQGVWLGLLKIDHDNLRQALETSMQDEDAIDSGLRLMAALSRYWFLCGHWSEGRALARSLLECHDASAASSDRSRVLNLVGNLCFWQGNYTRAQGYHEEALVIRRELFDSSGIAASLNNLGNVAERQGEYELARRYYEESLDVRRQAGDIPGTATALHNLAFVAENMKLYGQARVLCEESLSIRRENKDRSGVAMSLNSLGNVAYWMGDLDRARTLQEESLALHDDLQDRYGMALSRCSLGLALAGLGRLEEARECLRRSLEARRDLNDRSGIAMSLEACAVLAGASKCPHRAVHLMVAAKMLRDEIDQPNSPPESDALEALAADLRSELEEKAYMAEREKGEVLSLAEAILEALDS